MKPGVGMLDIVYCNDYSNSMSEPLHADRDQSWEIAGLVERASSLLAARGLEGVDARTVRWYQTNGILARPSRHEGRNAVYGYLHLLQLLAVRYWQAQGHSLATVQGLMVAKGIPELEGIVYPSVLGGVVADGWVAAPERADPRPSSAAVAAGASPGAAGSLAGSWTVTELAPGVLLMIDRRLVPDPEALVAAAPMQSMIKQLFPKECP